MEDRLYKFAVLVDTGNFTKAATKLHISQPALTTSIKKLERELHAELLIRRNHSFTLTTAGHIAYETAKQLHTYVQNFRVKIQEAVNDKVSLCIGMIDSIAHLLFVRGNQFRTIEENSRLSLTVNNSDELIKQVMSNNLDFALITQPSALPPSLDATFVEEEPLVLTTTHLHHDDTLEQLKKRSLQNFLSYNQNSQTYRLIETEFSAQSIRIEPTFYSTSPEIMLQLVLSNKGVAVLPYLLVREYVSSKQLTILPIGTTTYIGRPIICIRRTGRDLPAAATTLIAETAKNLKGMAQESTSL